MKKRVQIQLNDTTTLRGTWRDGKAVYFDPPASTEVKKLGKVGEIILVLATVCENPRVTERQRTPYAAMGADSIHGLAEDEATTTAPEPKPQRLNVSPEMLKFVECLMAKRDELAVVTVAEEAKIREAVNGLGFQILSDTDRESAQALVMQAREAIIVEKRRVAIEALQKEMSTVSDEMELATLEVCVPIITTEGVGYPLALVTTNNATGTNG